MTGFVSAPPRERLRVVHVGFDVDRQQRVGEELLDAWPTLPTVAAGASRAGVGVIVVQAAHRRHTVERDGVTFHFVDRAGVVDRVLACSPDVVHAHGLNHPLSVRRLAHSLRGIPLLVQDHGSVASRGWRGRLSRWAHRSVDGVAFTAREQAIPFFAAGALRPELPVFEVVEGSTAFGPGDRAAARHVTGMYGAPCFLWTGRLDANKDPLTALAAFERAAQRLPDARFWCCFALAKLRSVVERRVATSPLLRERVTLVGRRPYAEMELRFRAADFFVQTSHHEGSGYSIIEALACGTTPLVTDIPSARRIVGNAGSLTPVGDAEALAAAMVAFAAREADQLRRDARARFEAALSFDVIGHELRSAYETLAAERRK